MDIQDILHNAVAAQRAETLKNSPQMTLGELIAYLEPIAEKQKERIEEGKEEADVRFDFANSVPTGFSSWRGSYSELGINYSFNGYGDMKGYTKENHSTFEPKPMTVSEFLKEAKDCLGKTFTGWKGGDFTMGKTTPLWVANDGDSGNTGVIGIKDNGYSVILITGTCEY